MVEVIKSTIINYKQLRQYLNVMTLIAAKATEIIEGAIQGENNNSQE